MYNVGKLTFMCSASFDMYKFNVSYLLYLLFFTRTRISLILFLVFLIPDFEEKIEWESDIFSFKRNNLLQLL